MSGIFPKKVLDMVGHLHYTGDIERGDETMTITTQPTWMPDTLKIRKRMEAASGRLFLTWWGRTQRDEERRRHVGLLALAIYGELLWMAEGGAKRIVSMPVGDSK